MQPTDDVATDDQLAELFSLEEDDRDQLTAESIAVCDGEWRREAPKLWRFWQNAA